MQDAATQQIIRQVYRRIDGREQGAPLLHIVREPIPIPPPLAAVIIKIHAVSLNYRDANMIHGDNPWPVLSNGVPCSDAAGEVFVVGADVKDFQKGDRVMMILDQASITGREQERIWLAADVDGVLADYITVDANLICKIPEHLSWNEASTMPCAGLTAWSALKGVEMGATVLIQGTGGVSMMALKLARAAGCQMILSSSSDQKLQRISERYSSPPILTVNYATDLEWHKRVIRLNGGIGVDLVLENGGVDSLVRSLRCTKRGVTVSQVGYLGKQDANDAKEMLSVLIDKRVNLWFAAS